MTDRSLSVLMTSSDPNPYFKVTVLGKRLLYNTDRKQYTVYRLVAVLMTLNDLWPEFQGQTFLKSSKPSIPNLSNGSTFDDLAWPLNASRGHVSISWASCLYPSHNLRDTEMQDQKLMKWKCSTKWQGENPEPENAGPRRKEANVWSYSLHYGAIRWTNRSVSKCNILPNTCQ